MTSKTAQQKTLNKTNQTNIKTNTKTNIKTKKNQTTKTNTKFAGNPDYEFDTIKKRWVKKSDIRPIELVNRYKLFLEDYLQKNTNLDHKKIRDIVKKHATSTERLKELLVKEGAMTEKTAKKFFKNNSFWKKELCEHMKTICPNDTDLSAKSWCDKHEDAFFLYKDTNGKHVSCYSIDDIYDIISSSFTGGDDDMIFLQLPRDPYTRKIMDEKFIKNFLQQLRLGKERLNGLPLPHVVYFLRNYKKFYADPQIKPFLKKSILTNKEKWELSEAIEDFMLSTGEIVHGFTEKGKRWWGWIDDSKRPKDLYFYIFNKK